MKKNFLTTTGKKHKGLVLSDLHMGHHRVPASKVIAVKEKILTLDNLSTVDCIYESGDLFDKSLTLNNSAIPAIIEHYTDLIETCVKTNTALRILEGTPSHDAKQAKIIEALHNSLGSTCDFKYITDISIVYEPKWDLNVLYIPDEARPTTSAIYAEVKRQMEALGLEEVDLAIMHGQFDFQLPAVAKAPKHDSELYLGFVKHFIFIGHDHNHNHKDRIVIPGSLECLRFGESKPKGYLTFSIDEANGNKWAFHENVEATVWDDVDIQGLSPEDSLDKIAKATKYAPDGSHYRLLMEREHAFNAGFNQLNTHFIHVNLYKQIQGEVNVLEEIEPDNLPEMVSVTITSSNAKDLLLNRVSNESEAFINTCSKLLDKAIKGR